MQADDGDRTGLQPLVEQVRRGEYDVAIAGLKTFLDRYPGHEVGLGLLASAYFQIGMYDRAQAHYEHLLALHPGNALARFQLGLVHLSSNPVEALQLWRPLLAVEDEFMAHFHAGLAYVQLRDRENAIRMLDHAAKYMPVSHPLHGQLLQLRKSLREGAVL